MYAQIAQSVEQRTENPCVGGSIPPLGTTFILYIFIKNNINIKVSNYYKIIIKLIDFLFCFCNLLHLILLVLNTNYIL